MCKFLDILFLILAFFAFDGKCMQLVLSICACGEWEKEMDIWAGRRRVQVCTAQVCVGMNSTTVPTRTAPRAWVLGNRLLAPSDLLLLL